MGEFGSPFQTVLFFFLSDGFKKCGMKLGFFKKAKCLVKTIKKCFWKKLRVWLILIKVVVWDGDNVWETEF